MVTIFSVAQLPGSEGGGTNQEIGGVGNTSMFVFYYVNVGAGLTRFSSFYVLLTWLRYNTIKQYKQLGEIRTMDEFQSVEGIDYARRELLYCWVFGDLHYRAKAQWHAIHSRRMAAMFQDVNSLWLDEGFPAFCVSPGDIVDTGAEVNYRLAKDDLGAQLGKACAVRVDGGRCYVYYA
ncbi:MAG TPA: hypothetical protein VIY29_17255 [Ktedonobacteraceae bacterium]